MFSEMRIRRGSTVFLGFQASLTPEIYVNPLRFFFFFFFLWGGGGGFDGGTLLVW